MKIKLKLSLWVGLLFALIILLSVIGIMQIRSMTIATENILKDNYSTLEYTRHMLRTLDQWKSDTSARREFEHYLLSQEKNVTETGESALTENLRNHYKAWVQNPNDTTLIKDVRQDILQIMHLNLQALHQKSVIASLTADKALLYIPATAGLCFAIAFVILLNVPGSIANPIRELTESIKQIAAQKYSERVHFEGHDEFGELAHSFNTMAQKLEEYNNSNLSTLMMEKKRIETLINNMFDPVIGLDEERKILFANERALNILGLAAADCIGKSAQDVAMTNDLMRLLIQDLWQEKPPVQKKPLTIFADGKESYFEKDVLEIDIVPTGETQSIHIGDVIILRNVTHFKELDAAKTHLMATVSHEFKTPIAAIRMSLELLRKQEFGQLSDAQRELVESMEDDTNRLLRITGEILNLSQMESGKVQLNIQSALVSDIISPAIQSNSAHANQKQIRMIPTGVDGKTRVWADQEKTTWVLSNFISNAIRYSYDGSEIRIGIREDKDHIVFEVEDYGKGIPSQYQHRIFDKYFRIPGETKEGSGLGLAISKDLIEAQQGSIGVHSELGKGSLFYFLLPRSEVNGQTVGETA